MITLRILVAFLALTAFVGHGAALAAGTIGCPAQMSSHEEGVGSDDHHSGHTPPTAAHDVCCAQICTTVIPMDILLVAPANRHIADVAHVATPYAAPSFRIERPPRLFLA